jgi:hypothetical protein
MRSAITSIAFMTAFVMAVYISPARAAVIKLCKDDYSECIEKRVPGNPEQEAFRQEAPRHEFRDIRDKWRMTCQGSDGAPFIVRFSGSAGQLDTISRSGVVRHYVVLSNVDEDSGFRVRAVGTGARGGNRELNAWFSHEPGTLSVTGESPVIVTAAGLGNFGLGEGGVPPCSRRIRLGNGSGQRMFG